MTKAQKIADTLPMVEDQLELAATAPLATFKVPTAFVEKLQHNGMMFVLARADRYGTVKALSAVPANSDAMIRWAKGQIALFLAEQQERNAEATKAQLQDDAIQAAVAEVSAKTAALTETVGEVLAA